jgi:hypothetical protein
MCVLCEDNIITRLMVLESTKKCRKSRKINFQVRNGVNKTIFRRSKTPLRLGKGKRNRMMCVMCDENVGAHLMVLESTKKFQKSGKIHSQVRNKVMRRGGQNQKYHSGWRRKRGIEWCASCGGMMVCLPCANSTDLDLLMRAKNGAKYCLFGNVATNFILLSSRRGDKSSSPHKTHTIRFPFPSPNLSGTLGPLQPLRQPYFSLER